MAAVNDAWDLNHMNVLTREPTHIGSPTPVAIVGLAGRFPGEATNAKNLWDMCCQGRSAWSEVPKDRFNSEAYFHPNPSKSGCFNSRGAHFLKEDVALFDAPFFSITPSEAKAMDPQQRLLLETTYEAFENAGIALDTIRGSQTGVYVGASQVDYTGLLFKDVDDIPVYQSTGNSANMLSNRISYVFDLKALHTACQSLRTGEHTQVVVCGAHIMLNPDTMVGMSMLRSVYHTAGLDPDETTYVEAHGTGTAAGDPVEAGAIASVFTVKRTPDNPLLVGSVKSNIGHLEAASGLAAMVKTIFAMEEGVIPPNINFEKPNKDIPLEEWKLKVPKSLTAWPKFSTRRASISNFGFGGTNVHVILEQYKPTEYTFGDQTNATAPDEGNSTFENSQVLPPDPAEDNDTGHSRLPGATGTRRRRLFIFSANDKVALRTQMLDTASYIDQQRGIGDEEMMDRLAFTLCHRRSLLDWKEAVSASTVSELSSALASPDSDRTRPSGKPTIGFVFTGQGAQWFAMGRDLLCYTVFAEALQQADRILSGLGAAWSLLDELSKDAKSSLVNQAFLSQPATTAIQIALTRLFSSWGITPSAVVGHSSGEIGAAYAAGALTLEQCMSVAYHRGMLAETLTDRRPERPGGMLAIGASPAKVRPMVKRLGSAHAVIACFNAPSLVTVSGDARAISEIQAEAEEKSLLNRRLKVDVAYHSPHMRDIAGDYLVAIEPLEPNADSSIQFHSSVKGRQIDTAELTAAYWVNNLTSPVQFVDAIKGMYSKGIRPDILVEIGPHSALESPIRDIMKSSGLGSEARYLPSLVRDHDASLTTLSLASALHVLGCSLNLAAINNPRTSSPPKMLNDLPSYPWNHSKRYWHESRLSVNHRLRRFARSDLLGSLVDDFNENEPRWRNILRITDIPWLSDHKVQDSVVFPATGYLVMALEAIFQYGALHDVQIHSGTQYKLQEVKISRSMVLSEDNSTEVTLVLRPREEGSRNFFKSCMGFTISSWTVENGWVEHCQGFVSLHQDDEEPNPVNGERQIAAQHGQHKRTINDITSRCQVSISPFDVYSKFSRAGLEFGPAFQNVIGGRAAKDNAIATVSIPNTSERMPRGFESGLPIHPAAFDACLQVIEIADSGGDFSGSDLHVPTFFKEITIRHGLKTTPGTELRVLATRHRPFSDSDTDLHASFVVVDAEDEDRVLIQCRGFVGSQLPNQGTDNALTAERGLCFQVHWEPCLDLMTREQYAGAFTKSSNLSNVISQLLDLERAAFYYLQPAIESLSKHQNDIPQTHLRDLHRLVCEQMMQVQQGSLASQTSKWSSCTNDEKRRFLIEFASSGDGGRMICSMGENLVSIFKGEVEPLSVMLRDNMLEKYYRDLEILKLANTYCADIVTKLAHQNPNMRIIEIGAGTGSATMPVLRALGLRFAHYDFTDLSTGFFERAKEEQKEWGDRIGHLKLNVEVDPDAQGFQSESYDLVIAVNVLHATINLENTMRNVRRLLRTGGKVLLSEITMHALATSITFGTLPGWWLAEEAERKDGPLVTETAWDSVFRKTGFSGLDGSAQIRADPVSDASVMLTTAITQQRPGYPETCLVVCNEPYTGLVDAIRPVFQNLTGQVAPVERLREVDLNNKCGIVLAMGDSLFSSLNDSDFERMQVLFSTARGILWVTRGARSQNPEANMFTGFARCLRTENAGLRIVTLDLDEQKRLTDGNICDLILRVFEATFGQDSPNFSADTEFLETDGVLFVPRVLGNKGKDEYVVRETHPPVPISQPFDQKGRPLELKIGQAGQLDSIYFRDRRSLQHELGSGEVEISVKYIGMNFKDIMIALGQVPFSHDIGIECSGIVTAVGSNVTDISPGARVCAMTPGAYANITRVPQHRVAEVPDSLGLMEAATLPVVFCTAHYALTDIGRLCEGESILIHAAAGGVGQAAIMLAQKVKAEVFVTVGSLDKKSLVMETYGIPENHIFSSRDGSFLQELMTMTGQKGVDVVLNSTAGDLLRQSWRCLAPLGRFIEIGKRDIVQNSHLEMEKFLDCVSFSAIDLSVMETSKPQLFKRILTDVVNMYRDNSIHRITPITVYPISEIQKAMRQMQSGKHTGKIVIKATGDSIVQALPATSPRAVPDGAAASYLITGGTGGLGKFIARWLAREGARNIVLASRSGMSQKGVQTLLEELRAKEVNVVVMKCDIADRAQVQKLISECQATLPPIKGVIHGAMALRDALFEKMSFTDWNLNIKPRVQGVWNLHHCLADVKLDFFLMLASSAGFIGTAGQAAYAASNTFLDAFASYRKGLGLPACAIDIGMVESVGYVAEHKEREAELTTTVQDRLTENELLALVKAAVTGAFSGNDDDQQTLTGLRLWPDKPMPPWASDPKFVHILADAQSDTVTAVGEDRGGMAVQQRLKQAESLEQVVEMICDALVLRIATLLTSTVEDVDRKKPVVAYGLDSLVAVELRNWITLELEANVPLMELMGSPSIENLAGKIANKSRLVDQALFREDKD